MGQLILKADIHCHIEGTATPEMVRKLAARNRVSLPDWMFTPDGGYAWSDFTSFLATYDAATAAICTARDYEDVVFDYLARSAAQGLMYAEIFASPDHAASSGLAYRDMLAGLSAGVSRAETTHNVTARIIIVAVRHLGPERAVDAALTAASQPNDLVTGFGMAGDERVGTPADYARAFNIAHEAGLGCTVHAGEVVGPESVASALDHLPVSRIGHGIRAIEDPDLIARIREEQITLEVCPGSNLALGLYREPSLHPLKRLKDAGCRITVNADDPPFFSTSIGDEYAFAANVMGFAPDDLLALTKTAIEAAFLDAATREGLLGRLAAIPAKDA